MFFSLQINAYIILVYIYIYVCKVKTVKHMKCNRIESPPKYKYKNMNGTIDDNKHQAGPLPVHGICDSVPCRGILPICPEQSIDQ